MVTNIHNLIAAVSPDIFCDPALKGEVKELAKESGFLKAAEKAKPRDTTFMDFDSESLKNPFKAPGQKNPIEKHVLIYDAFGEGLEPVYFWILDTLAKFYPTVDKITDTFVASAGSAHFAEMGQRATKMQEEAMKILGTVNQIIRSIMNIIYDLKEFKIRLAHYKGLESKNPHEKKASLLSLKQLWMDTVDLKRSGSSLKGFAVQQGSEYVTLIDAFMVADTLEEVDKLDLNDRVKRIVQQRLPEFLHWVKESESELKKRYSVEKIYLRSQVNAIQLYARWIKPYLNAARALEQNATPTAALVSTFNTSLLELTLLAQGKYDPNEDVQSGNLPGMVSKAQKRAYSPLLVVEFKFRTAPERLQQQGYGFRGRVEMTFTSYALNDEEIKLLKKELEKDDIGAVLGLIKGATEESLEKLQADIDDFLNEDEEKKEEKKKEESDDSNPFAALFSWKSSKKEKKDEKKKEELKEVKPDSDVEKALRSQSIIGARKLCFTFYELYKKLHGMLSFP
ncbi:MAG TPA: hypothetical protein VJK51_04745 [Candidatus Nanoarchaeia archaeon]|nr:hypothetical protein [Candidatus Nanoarchaeia archaeon]